MAISFEVDTNLQGTLDRLAPTEQSTFAKNLLENYLLTEYQMETYNKIKSATTAETKEIADAVEAVLNPVE